MIITNQQERMRFIRFAIVGSIGAIVDFGLFNFLISIVRLPSLGSSVISFLAAVLSNYIWNRLWTYPDSRTKTFSYQLAQFFLVSVIGLVIRTLMFDWEEPLVVTYLSNIQLNFPISSTALGQNLALASVIVVVMFWNYFVNRYWTYSDIK